MVRRLSITVPDELWDSLSHLEQSPSALVQRSLRCLRESEGINRQLTPLEKAATNKPEWQAAVEALTDDTTRLRAEGYENLVMAMADSAISINWVEWVCENYPLSALPRLLSQAADQYLRSPGTTPETSSQPLAAEQSFEKTSSKWAEKYQYLVNGVNGIIKHRKQEEIGDKDEHLRSISLESSQLGPDSEPTTGIPLSFFDGMAHAIFDIVSTVRIRAHEENSPTTLGNHY